MYKVIHVQENSSFTGLKQFEDSIIEMLGKGYKCVGGVCVTKQIIEKTPFITYSQALIKSE